MDLVASQTGGRVELKKSVDTKLKLEWGFMSRIKLKPKVKKQKALRLKAGLQNLFILEHPPPRLN